MGSVRVGNYELKEVLGEGTFGKVRRACHVETGEEVAIKIMEKSNILEHDMTLQVRREITIMKALNHQNIVKLHQVLQSPKKLYMVMELVRGGELFTLLHGPGGQGRAVDESTARKYCRQIIDAVSYCHKRGVAHRDLKPENLLVDEKGNLKISDFGLSAINGENVNHSLLYTQVGTPEYVAPEMILGVQGYNGAKLDSWAIGVILYHMLAGHLPFQSVSDEQNDLEKLFDAIISCNIKYPPWISAEAKDLIDHIIVSSPEERYSLKKIKNHRWFREGNDRPRPSKVPTLNLDIGLAQSSSDPIKRKNDRTEDRPRPSRAPPQLTLDFATGTKCSSLGSINDRVAAFSIDLKMPSTFEDTLSYGSDSIFHYDDISREDSYDPSEDGKDSRDTFDGEDQYNDPRDPFSLGRSHSATSLASLKKKYNDRSMAWGTDGTEESSVYKQLGKILEIPAVQECLRLTEHDVKSQFQRVTEAALRRKHLTEDDLMRFKTFVRVLDKYGGRKSFIKEANSRSGSKNFAKDIRKLSELNEVFMNEIKRNETERTKREDEDFWFSKGAKPQETRDVEQTESQDRHRRRNGPQLTVKIVDLNEGMVQTKGNRNATEAGYLDIDELNNEVKWNRHSTRKMSELNEWKLNKRNTVNRKNSELNENNFMSRKMFPAHDTARKYSELNDGQLNRQSTNAYYNRTKELGYDRRNSRRHLDDVFKKKIENERTKRLESDLANKLKYPSVKPNMSVPFSPNDRVSERNIPNSEHNDYEEPRTPRTPTGQVHEFSGLFKKLSERTPSRKISDLGELLTFQSRKMEKFHLGDSPWQSGIALPKEDTKESKIKATNSGNKDLLLHCAEEEEEDDDIAIINKSTANNITPGQSPFEKFEANNEILSGNYSEGPQSPSQITHGVHEEDKRGAMGVKSVISKFRRTTTRAERNIGHCEIEIPLELLKNRLYSIIKKYHGVLGKKKGKDNKFICEVPVPYVHEQLVSRDSTEDKVVFTITIVPNTSKAFESYNLFFSRTKGTPDLYYDFLQKLRQDLFKEDSPRESFYNHGKFANLQLPRKNSSTPRALDENDFEAVGRVFELLMMFQNSLHVHNSDRGSEDGEEDDELSFVAVPASKLVGSQEDNENSDDMGNRNRSSGSDFVVQKRYRSDLEQRRRVSDFLNMWLKKMDEPGKDNAAKDVDREFINSFHEDIPIILSPRPDHESGGGSGPSSGKEPISTLVRPAVFEPPLSPSTKKNTGIKKFVELLKTKNQKLGDSLTQFETKIPPQVASEILGRILTSMGSTVFVQRDKRRKLKCEIYLKDSFKTCFSLEIIDSTTKGMYVIMFKRNKSDGNRTDLSAFVEMSEEVRNKFLEEAKTLVDKK